MKTFWSVLCLTTALTSSAFAYGTTTIFRAPKGEKQPSANVVRIAKTVDKLAAGTKRSFGKWKAESDPDGVSVVKQTRRGKVEWYFSHLGPAQRRVGK